MINYIVVWNLLILENYPRVRNKKDFGVTGLKIFIIGAQRAQQRFSNDHG